MPSQKQRKGHIVQNENIQRYVSVKFPVKSCKISNMNVTEWLATPGGTKFLKPIEEMSKEERNVFQKRFFEERSHTVSLLKFINKILLRAATDRFLRARYRSTNHFPISPTLLLLKQI